jgi:hypothetical protein
MSHTWQAPRHLGQGIYIQDAVYFIATATNEDAGT